VIYIFPLRLKCASAKNAWVTLAMHEVLRSLSGIALFELLKLGLNKIAFTSMEDLLNQFVTV
jgi:hypothetical protein